MHSKIFIFFLLAAFVSCTYSTQKNMQNQSCDLILHLDFACKVFRNAITENEKFAMDYQDVVLMNLFSVIIDGADKNNKIQTKKIRSLYQYHLSSIKGGDSIEGWSDIGKKLSQLENE